MIARQIANSLAHAEQALEFIRRRARLFRRDSPDFRQGHWVGGDDLQRVGAERVHDTPGQRLADIGQRAGGEVPPDGGDALRQAHLKRFGPELLAETRVRNKAPVQRYLLAYVDTRQLPHRGVQFLPAGKLQHGIAVCLVAVNDIFHCARKGFPFLFLFQRHARLLAFVPVFTMMPAPAREAVQGAKPIAAAHILTANSRLSLSRISKCRFLSSLKER